MSIQSYRSQLDKRKGKLEQIESTIENLTTEIRDKKRDLIRHQEANEIVKIVGQTTQEELQYHISDITSLAIESVFPNNPYKLEVEFVQRRNKTECDIFFVRDGNRVEPTEASGGGTVDVAAFALRIASWAMQLPHSRNTIILDEPMKWVSANYQEQASAMIKEISKRLHIQFIIVTHQPILTSFADKVFEVSIKNGVSQIT